MRELYETTVFVPLLPLIQCVRGKKYIIEGAHLLKDVFVLHLGLIRLRSCIDPSIE
jgi:hypothetical protein